MQQQPHHVIALNLQGTLYLQYNDYLQALHSYQLATQLKADFSEAWYHCGLVLEKLKRYHEAVNHYQKAISLKPHYINALNNCANVLVGLQDYPQAIKLLTQLVESSYPYAAGRIFYLQTHICDWKDYHATVAFLRQGIAQQQAVISPFEFFNVPASPHEQLICAESYVLKNYPAQSKSFMERRNLSTS